MLRYLLIRLVWLIPTLLVVSLIAFFISYSSPIDPVQSACGLRSAARDLNQYDRCKARIIQEFHLAKPAFYFSVTSWAFDRELLQITEIKERAGAERLLFEWGDWQRVKSWRQASRIFQTQSAQFSRDSLSSSSLVKYLEAHNQSQTLLQKPSPKVITATLALLKEMYAAPGLESLQQDLAGLTKQWETLSQSPPRWRSYLPRFQGYGWDNQYHHWISGLLTELDFGKRIQREASISQDIGRLFWITASLTLGSTFLIFLIGIPLGMLAATRRDTWMDRGLAVLLFAFRAVPEFWLGTILLMLFANADIPALHWFKSSVNISHPNPIDNLLKYVLPLIAYTYGSLAVVSRTVRVSLLDTLQEDFIRTARVKGLSEKRVLYRHALRNALLPMITLLGGLLPALLGGAIVLETVFDIPGMGNEIFGAMLANDRPFLLAIFSLIGFLTVLGYLVTDLLYAWLDPRIRLGGTRS